MSERYDIRCANCSEMTGAVFMGGDPYLPYILCASCADAEEESDRAGLAVEEHPT